MACFPCKDIHDLLRRIGAASSDKLQNPKSANISGTTQKIKNLVGKKFTFLTKNVCSNFRKDSLKIRWDIALRTDERTNGRTPRPHIVPILRILEECERVGTTKISGKTLVFWKPGHPNFCGWNLKNNRKFRMKMVVSHARSVIFGLYLAFLIGYSHFTINYLVVNLKIALVLTF